MAGANTPTWPMRTKGGDVAGAARVPAFVRGCRAKI